MTASLFLQAPTWQRKGTFEEGARQGDEAGLVGGPFHPEPRCLGLKGQGLRVRGQGLGVGTRGCWRAMPSIVPCTRGTYPDAHVCSEGAAKDMRNALNVQPELQQAMQCLRRCQGSGAGKDAKENDGDVQAARQAKKGGQMPASQPDGSNAATGGSRAERTRRRKQDDGDAALRDALFSKFGKDFRAAGAAGREFQLSGKVPASFKPDISDDDDDDKGEEGENGFAGSGGDDDDASDDDVSELEGKETKEETGQDVAPFAKGATKREHEANAGKKIADARPRRDDFHVLAGKKLATAQHAKVKPLAPIKTKVGVEKGDAPLLVPQIANEEVQGDMDRDDLDGDEEKVDDEEDSTDSTSDVSDVSDGAVIGYEDVMEAVKAGKEKHDGEEENPRRKKIIELARQLVEEGDGSDDDSRESSGSDSSTSDSDSGKQDEDDDQDDEEGKKRNVSSVAPTRGANLTFSQAAERRVSAKLLKAERRALFEREANNTFRQASLADVLSWIHPLIIFIRTCKHAGPSYRALSPAASKR